MTSYDNLVAKWAPVLDHPSLPRIRDNHRREVTAAVLEQTEKAIRESRADPTIMNFTQMMGGSTFLTEDSPTNSMGGSSSTQGTGPIDLYDPIMISLVRRTAPNLISYDVCGVQPMNGPASTIFAMRAHYDNTSGTEAFFNEPLTDNSTIVAGTNVWGQKHVGGYPGNTTTGTSNLAETGIYNRAIGMNTAVQEALGSNTTYVFPEMAITMEKATVTAKGRGLKAEYSIEFAQDLKTIHGLGAETVLSGLLTNQLMADINREVIGTINFSAMRGAALNTTTPGRFNLDVDSGGRWSVERWKGLFFFIETECNEIAKATRRGKGNFIICSSNVASALQMAGILDYTPALQGMTNLQVDDTGITFAGVIGRTKVFIDPYATGNYATVGYKGADSFDAGLFYCPYVPMQMVRATDPNTMQPKFGFKTRYGIVAHPFASVTYDSSTGIYTPVQDLGVIKKDSNSYYRRVLIDNLL